MLDQELQGPRRQASTQKVPKADESIYLARAPLLASVNITHVEIPAKVSVPSVGVLHLVRRELFPLWPKPDPTNDRNSSQR